MKAKIDRDGNLVITPETRNEVFQLSLFKSNPEGSLIFRGDLLEKDEVIEIMQYEEDRRITKLDKKYRKEKRLMFNM
jgi:hypothetical protein